MEPLSIAIVSPFPPPYGGMSVQADKLGICLSNEGHNIVKVSANPPFPGVLSYFASVKGVRTFIRFLLFIHSLNKVRNVRIVHILAASHFYFFAAVVPAVIISRLLNKKVIINYRGGEAEQFFERWGKLALPFLKTADHLVVPSQFLKDVFSKFLLEDISILPNLADIEKFRYRQRAERRPVLVVSRQLEPLYNHACILRAFKIIRERHSSAILKICGTGSEERKLKELMEQMGIRGAEFLGGLDHARLAEVYDEADIMVNASRADNFPGAILEAFMCGISVVSTDVGGIPCMVVDGETGLLVPDDNHNALADAVERLLVNPAQALAMAINARKMAEQYSWGHVRRKLYELYAA